jgi:hypothetical protein
MAAAGRRLGNINMRAQEDEEMNKFTKNSSFSPCPLKSPQYKN